MSEHGKETIKKIFEHVKEMTPQQRKRVMEIVEAISFLKEAKK